MCHTHMISGWENAFYRADGHTYLAGILVNSYPCNLSMTDCLVHAEVTESPEGRGVVECVVSVPNEFLSQIPQTKDYLQQLRQITPSVTSK